MTTTPTHSAIAINYIPLNIPSIGELTDKKLNEIVVATQGEAVEIMDTIEVVSAMKIFHYLYKFSPECIYRTLKNNRYLLFDHQAVPVIRDGDVIHYFPDETISSRLPIIPQTTLEVEDLWNRTNGTEFDRTKQLLSILQDKPPAEEVILVGNASALVFLFAQEFYEGVCKSLSYQKTNQNETVKIY